MSSHGVEILELLMGMQEERLLLGVRKVKEKLKVNSRP